MHYSWAEPKQRGTAIITALFIVGLVVTIAITLITRLSRDVHRTELLLNSIQAQLYAEGSLAWAIDSLNADVLQAKANEPIDHLPLHSPPERQQNYFISSTLEDATGYFNVNNLIHEEWYAPFRQLLQYLNPALSAETIQQITVKLAAWISPRDNNSADEHHTFAAHRPLAHISELQLIPGITPEIYNQLLPYVIALPDNTPINVNTAAAPVLHSLSPTLTPQEASLLEHKLQQTPLGDLALFLNTDLVRQHPFPQNKIALNSHYFILETRIEQQEQHLILHTLLQRNVENAKPVVSVLWQTKG
jgi:general secretion pathway protein K